MIPAEDAYQRVVSACSELLAVHDAIKHGDGIEANFPFPHKTGGTDIYLALDEACFFGNRAARLLHKLTVPEAMGRSEP